MEHAEELMIWQYEKKPGKASSYMVRNGKSIHSSGDIENPGVYVLRGQTPDKALLAVFKSFTSVQLDPFQLSVTAKFGDHPP